MRVADDRGCHFLCFSFSYTSKNNKNKFQNCIQKLDFRSWIDEIVNLTFLIHIFTLALSTQWGRQILVGNKNAMDFNWKITIRSMLWKISKINFYFHFGCRFMFPLISMKFLGILMYLQPSNAHIQAVLQVDQMRCTCRIALTS